MEKRGALWLVALFAAAFSPSVPAPTIFADGFEKITAWDLSQARIWQWEDLEGQVSYCAERSVRWTMPITSFDLNNDNKNDLLIPISCYQGPDPEPGEKHNRGLIAAWVMFCSGPDGHYDCTQELFGTPVINATGTNSQGGNPYAHQMETPFDINGDGYPDFWYALNRDDGRPGFDINDAEDAALLESFCGPREPDDWEWDCTRKAIQTVILSKVGPNGELSYEVKEIPWGERNTQAMAVLPNHLDGYDLMAFNYGQWTVARVGADNSVTDVSAEYESYKNISVALSLGRPYIRVFEHEDTHYLAAAEVNYSTYNNPDAGTWEVDPEYLALPGFTLWQWIPGVGFELSDFFVPAEEDRFEYTVDSLPGGFGSAGAWVRGLPSYGASWHFFRLARLAPDEEPVLVVVQESATTGGDYFGAQPDPEKIYTYDSGDHVDLSAQLLPILIVEAFYIRDGKLVPRERSVVDGDVMWNLPSVRFADLTGNGIVDMYGFPGNEVSGQVFLNDGSGTMRKVKLEQDWPFPEQLSGSGNPGSKRSFVLNLGRAPYLDFFFWDKGVEVFSDFMGPEYTEPSIGLIEGAVPITRLPIQSPSEVQEAIKFCQVNGFWMGNCLIF